jgi:hypothetical protein
VAKVPIVAMVRVRYFIWSFIIDHSFSVALL